MFTNNHIKLDSIDSTNAYVLSLQNMSVLKEGLVVTTNYQSGGNGQRGKAWESNANENLLLSVVIEPRISISRQFDISKIVSLSICDLLTNLDLNPEIKWPNDILISKKKIAGVLIQNKLQGNLIMHSIIGIGLNINQMYFKDYLPKATSLQLLLGKKFDINKVRLQLLHYLSDRIKKYRQGAPQMEEYLKILYLKDKVAAFQTKRGKFMGIIKEVRQSGKLLIQIEDDKITEFENQTIKYLF
ncbi:biotin--[acetyl-CoA-carboxylase] ligase [Flavobacteriales bacterium]|nr:biotin--[acetyl-CoA-carboxylase] ligase [Flavobacteriales bacterium]